MKCIGILGGGQLGRMLALSARRFGLQVLSLDPDAAAACAEVAQHHVAAYEDIPAVLAFAQQCDVLTFEFENIPQATVAAVEAQGHRIVPSARVLSVTQDRGYEKQMVRACGLHTAPFALVDSEADLEVAELNIGFPAILKTRRGGYDGKGQWRVADRAALDVAFEDAQRLAGGAPLGLILEGVVPFERELSIVAARSQDGALIVFPITENTHRNGILISISTPAMISSSMREAVESVARVIGEALAYVGVFAVETFLIDDEIIVNEIAPRVHNSGHHTLEACSVSQFEVHVRAMLGYPLAPPRLLSPAVMLNLLGTGEGDELLGIDELLEIPEVTLHLYGKGEARARRKMGHVTILGRTLQEAQDRAATAASKLAWGVRQK